MNDTLKALSILQPWAWLIVNGWKPIENRSWRTNFRGQFLVHAGKRWGDDQRADVEFVREQFPHIRLPERYDLGGIVGMATVTDCIDTSENLWFFGPYGFLLTDARPLPFQPCQGMLNFFRPELPST